ncbi:MAG: thiamine pyrophosphate-binding protein [Actinomycetes bacterium]
MAGVEPKKYAEQFVDWLGELGYTHCFFLAGGNIMHLLDAVRTRMTCIPVVHEVAAGIAAEYFNEVCGPDGPRAFALVTAGPGVTNAMTAVAGAYSQSRDLLVVGGQVKAQDLAGAGLRQRGIQEIDGMAVMEPLCVAALQVTVPVDRDVVRQTVLRGLTARRGPVFIEFCLDAQAAPPLVGEGGAQSTVGASAGVPVAARRSSDPSSVEAADIISALLGKSTRPILLIGGGVTRACARQCRELLADSGIPVVTSWNGADRVDSTLPTYWGRPDTWGMRSSNMLLQQADLIVALGNRLSMQQTGFNWQRFAPVGTVVQVEVDEAELGKGHPAVDVPLRADANAVLPRILASGVELRGRWESWRKFGAGVRAMISPVEPANATDAHFVNPFEFGVALSEHAGTTDIVIPSSSGGTFTSIMQTFAQRADQLVVSDNALASMGYGLSGAIGAALAYPDRRILHLEGDGGFAQNLQELGTVRAQNLNIKSFLYCNEGYASIRMTQRNYFGGAYLGCDTKTGLGMPDWAALFAAYGIECLTVDPRDPFDADMTRALAQPGPYGFLLTIDPEQSYFPKITSRVRPDGGMESRPLHLMSPDLEPSINEKALAYLPVTERS